MRTFAQLIEDGFIAPDQDDPKYYNVTDAENEVTHEDCRCTGFRTYNSLWRIQVDLQHGDQEGERTIDPEVPAFQVHRVTRVEL